MASLAKRRKKNDYNSSPSAVRNIDHFFVKQNKKTSNGVAECASVAADTLFGSVIGDGLKVANATGEPSDEEIARRLQAEWNNDPVSTSSSPVPHIENSHEASRPPHKDPHELLPHKKPELKRYQGGLQTNGSFDREKEERLSLEGRQTNTSSHDNDAWKGAATETPVYARQEEDGRTSNAPSSTSVPTPSPLSLQSTASAEDAVSLTIPFDENQLSFQPSKYVSELRRHWASGGGDASYALLTRCFVLVNSTTSRIKIVDNLVNFLRVVIEADPDSLLPAVSGYS